MGQSGGASRWRVCYQRGLPRLVSKLMNKPAHLPKARQFGPYNQGGIFQSAEDIN